MRMVLSLTALLGATLGTAPAPAQTLPTRVTLKALTAVCAENRDVCLAYIVGVADSFSSALFAAKRPQIYCFREATNDQIAQTTVRYVRAHQQEPGVNAAMVVIAALKENYPCGY